MFQRILVPLDGSACAEAALPYAKKLAEQFQSELIFLRVIEPSPAPAVPSSSLETWTPDIAVLSEAEDVREEVAQEYVEKIADNYRSQGGVVTEVDWGGPVDQIIHCAKERDADLIIMGWHGRHGLEKLLLGSAAESVLHHTDIPIMLIKEPHPKKSD
jgi:nucleotide-binding universal stress UspA family protein